MAWTNVAGSALLKVICRNFQPALCTAASMALPRIVHTVNPQLKNTNVLPGAGFDFSGVVMLITVGPRSTAVAAV
jgi:hypothetical protein